MHAYPYFDHFISISNFDSVKIVKFHIVKLLNIKYVKNIRSLSAEKVEQRTRIEPVLDANS